MSPHSFEFYRLTHSPLALESIGTACFVFCLGVVTVKRERANDESLSFFKLMSAIGSWLFGCSWMYASGDAETAFWWAKIAHIGIAFIPSAAFELSTVMMQDFQISRKKVQSLWAISFFFLIVILATDLQFSSMYHYDWGFYPHYLLTGIPFLIYFFGTLIAVIIRYVRGFHLARHGTSQKRKGRIVLLAVLIAYIGLIDFFPTFGIAVYPIGFSAIIVLALILFYTTWRYRFIAITPSFAADSIIKIMGDGLLVLDNEGFIRVANNSLHRIFHARDGSMIGMRPSEVVSDAEGFGARLEDLLLKDELRDFEINHRDEGGTILTFSLASSIMRNQLNERLATVCVVRDITERKQAERERKQLEEQSRRTEMALELSIAEERERSAIATELHDRIGQDLALAKIKLGMLAKSVTGKKANTILSDIREILDGAIRGVRTLTRRVGLSILESGSLTIALKCLCRQVEKDYGLRVLFQDDGHEKSVSLEIRKELHYSVRELLINVAKHATAKSTRVVTSSKNGGVLIRVEDDGIGFDPVSAETFLAEEGGGFGLFNIRRRIIHLGGEFDVESAPGNGCRISISIPLTDMRE
jgi:PAS domain S-box-containing protein